MKKAVIIMVLALVLSASAALAGGDVPVTLAGITLGDDVKKYAACCDMQQAHPLPDAPFLTEVHLKSDFVPGIRGGSLTYANCDDIGKLVRIKFKFHDRSEKLFKKLLEKYEAAYGKPDSYEGDAFRNIIAWKWNFVSGGDRVSLLLMWSRRKEMRPGVSIKMTLESVMSSEYLCYEEKYRRLEASKGGPSKIKSLDDFVAK